MNYLSKNEIYFLDYFFRSFFKIFKNKINQNYKEKNKILVYLKIFFLFLKDDYKLFLKRELATQKQFSLSSLNFFSYYSLLRTPLKLIAFTSVYPLIFFYKICKIEYINIRYKNKKIKFNRYN